MKSLILILLVTVVGISCESQEDSHAVVPTYLRDGNFIENSVKFIEELVAKLINLGKQALEAVSNFSSELLEKAKQFKDRVLEELEKLRETLLDAIQNITDQYNNSGTELRSSVKECIESHRQDAELLFNNTLQNVMECADKRIDEINKLIAELKTVSNNALELGNDMLAEMKKCVETHNGSFLWTTKCIGTVIINQTQAAVYMAQIVKLTSRITVALATLPASLQLCAGASLVEAGIKTGKILLEIRKCSVASGAPDVEAH